MKEKLLILAIYLGIMIVSILVVSGIVYWIKIFKIIN